MEFLYKKIFKYDPEGNLLLTNSENLKEYINEKSMLLYSLHDDKVQQLNIKKKL